MKDIENKLNAFFEDHQAKTKTTSALDEHILDKALKEQTSSQVGSPPPMMFWRQLMKQKRTWISASAAAILVCLALTFFTQTSPAAYAIGETLEAIKTVQTVQFKAFLFKQQTEINCYMRFSDEAAKPTHVRLSMEGFAQRKIDNEHGSFAYNAITNRFRRNTRDERKFNWYPDFRQLFSDTLMDVRYNKRIQMDNIVDPNTGQEQIVLDIPDKLRDIRFWIDKETKLPIRLATTEIHNLKALQRKTIAARDIWDIRYNEPLPENCFDIPTDAEEVFEEIDVHVTPDMGMPIGNLSHREACIQLIYAMAEAANRLDFETVCKLYFPMIIPPHPLREQLETLKAESQQPMLEIISHESPYEEGPYWYVRCRAKDIMKGETEDLVRIRFFEFDGITSCIIAKPD